jgi:hypothetical protein
MNGKDCFEKTCWCFHPDVCDNTEHVTGKIPKKSDCRLWHLRIPQVPWRPTLTPASQNLGNCNRRRSPRTPLPNSKGYMPMSNGQAMPGSVAALKEEVE